MKVWGIQYDKPQLYIPFPYFCTECSFQCNTTLIPSLGPTPRGCGMWSPVAWYDWQLWDKCLHQEHRTRFSVQWSLGLNLWFYSWKMIYIDGLPLHLICKQTNSSIHLCDDMLQFGLCVHFKAMLKSSHCSVTDKYKCVSQPNQHPQYIYV